MTDLKVHYPFELNNKVVLVIGAGGVANGLLPVLLSESPAKALLINRTRTRAEQLISEITCPETTQLVLITNDKLSKMETTVDLVINTTSSSVDDVLPCNLPLNLLADNALLYDVVMFDNKLTAFEAYAYENNRRYANGLGMGVEQAKLAFTWWNDLTIEIDSKLVLTHFRSHHEDN